MRFNFRKIASALASTAMVGTTVALAAAANYPGPFVNNGAGDYAIVYGAAASNTDLVASSDIASNLAGLTTDDAPATLEGESYPLFTSSSPLLLNSSLNSIRSSATGTDLPTVLGETSFSVISGSTQNDVTATHFVYLGSNPRVIYAKQPTSNDDPQAGVFYGTTAGNYLYNATVSFNRAVNFTHADTEGETIDLFGQEFTVASATDDSNIVLFRSAEEVNLNSETNPSQVVEVGGESFTVELVSASDSAATIRLTDGSGESDTKEINEDASKTILGVEVAVNTADETNFNLAASLIVGTSKIKLTDGSEVRIGSDEDSIDGTNVDFNDGATAYPGGITKLTIQVFAESGSDDFITPGNAVVDPVFSNLAINFLGLTNDGDREEISLGSGGDDKLTIDFTNWQDKTLTGFEWLNNESSQGGRAFLGGDNDNRLFVRESARINESAYAVVGNEDEAYLIQLRTLQNDSSTTPNDDDVIFSNAFDSTEDWEATFTSEGEGTISIGGKTYNVKFWDDKAGNNDANVRLNYPDSTGTNEIVAYPSIETGMGAKLIFYEPLLVNLSDAHQDTFFGGGAWKNVTAIKIPDGDGYTDITVAATPASAGSTAANVYNYTITVGSGSATHVMTNTTVGSNSADGLIGPLRWNVTGGGLAVGGNAAAVRSTAYVLLEEIDGTTINTPAIVLLEEQDDASNYNAVIVKIGGAGTTDNGVGISDVDLTWNRDGDMVNGAANGASGFQHETDDKIYSMMDIWGTVITTDRSSSDQYTAVISYPDEQVSAEVYLAEADATTGGSAGAMTVRDTEVSSVSGKNLIVVGGSCVNTVAASLLGSDVPMCGPSFTDATGVGAGQYLIQTFQSPFASGKIATLVAGYNAGDTTNAATYLRTQTPVTDVGTKYIGTTATEATLQTA